MDPSGAKKRIATFLVLTLVFSAVFWFLILSAGTIQASGGLLTAGLMWCPGLAALVTSLVYRRSLRGLGWRLGSARWLLVSYGLPLGYAAVVYILAWVTGLGGFTTESLPSGQPLPVFVLINASFIFLLGGLPTALGEETGWRGFLVAELRQVTTFTKTALISGAIWALWHMPLLLFADYNAAAPLWFAAPCFFLLAMGISFPLAWLRLKSGSLWTAAILHASHNVFIQAVFDPLTRDTGSTSYFVTEFGVGLALMALLVAWLTWRKRDEV